MYRDTIPCHLAVTVGELFLSILSKETVTGRDQETAIDPKIKYSRLDHYQSVQTDSDLGSIHVDRRTSTATLFPRPSYAPLARKAVVGRSGNETSPQRVFLVD